MEEYFDEKCTCKDKEHEPHTCPFSMEMSDGEDDSLCTCCPYCEEQCALDI